MEPAVKSRTWARNRLIRDGIYQAIYEQMKMDPSIYLFGEGSHMKVHFDAPYIEKEFSNRVITLPICVKGDTLILGDNKPISSLTMGSHAFGGNGELNEVFEVMKRPFSGDVISIKVRYLQEIVATPEHPVKVVRRESLKFECGVFRPQDRRNQNPEWVPVRKVEKGDFLVVPRLKSEPTTSALDLGSYRKYKSDSRALDSFPVNPDTAWLLGLYVAEGCTNLSVRGKEYIQFSLHENELTLVAKVREIFASLGNGYKVGVHKKPDSHGIELHVSCTILARAIGVWCGKGALDKQVPDFIMTTDNQIKTAFLRGLFDGDGCLSGSTKSLHSSSKKLVLQAQLLVASLGGMMGVSYRKPQKAMLKSENRVIQSKESWWLEGSSPDVARIFGHAYGKQPQRNYVVTGDSVLVPVTSVSKQRYEGDVFNIETTDHTYLVNNAIVHNCEDGNTNFAVGASLVGIKPIVDVISSDFLFRTMDSICVTPDTLVLGDNKPIVEYTAGDSCFGRSGKVEVVYTYRRQYVGPIVEVKAVGLLPFNITPEHPVLTLWGDCLARFGYQTKLSKPRWKKAGELVPKLGNSSGDYLLVPRVKGRELTAEIDLSPYAAPQRGRRNSGIVLKIPLTAETAWLIGLYIAEGFAVQTRGAPRTPQYTARLTLGKGEIELAEKAKIIAEKVGIRGRIREKSSTIWVDLYSVPLTRYLIEQCGRGARNKRIPESILLHKDTRILRSLLDGYVAGDGCITPGTHPGNSPILSQETSSLILAQQLQFAWARLGVLSGIAVGKQPRMVQGRPVKVGLLYHIRHPLYSGPNRSGIRVLADYIAVPIRGAKRIEGYRGEVCNLETSDNTYLVSNAVVHNCNTSAKLNHVSGGIDEPKTIVIRSEFFFGGPSSGQRLESLFTHIPGLSVVVPSNPRDARGLMNTALTKPGVTVFFEDRMISDADAMQDDIDSGVTEKIPFGKAKVRRQGTALTIVSYAVALREVEAVIDANKIDCDLIDLRTLYPLDCDTICSSVSKTGRLLIVEPDVTFAGSGAEVAASVAERCFESLRKPVVRLGAPRTTIPVSLDLHRLMIPSREEILSAIRGLSG